MWEPALPVSAGALRLAAGERDLNGALVSQFVERGPIHAAPPAIGSESALNAGDLHNVGQMNALVPPHELLHDGRFDARSDDQIRLNHSAKTLEVGVAVEGINESTDALGVKLVEAIQELPSREGDSIVHRRIGRHDNSLAAVIRLCDNGRKRLFHWCARVCLQGLRRIAV